MGELSVAATFDYNQLDSDIRALAQQSAKEINSLINKGNEITVEIGKRLSVMKAKMEHGTYTKWLEGEFGWNYQTARRFMNIAEKFSHVKTLNITKTALYILSEPSTPAEARFEASKMAEDGEQVNIKKAKELAAKYKGEKPQPFPAHVTLSKPVEVFPDEEVIDASSDAPTSEVSGYYPNNPHPTPVNGNALAVRAPVTGDAPITMNNLKPTVTEAKADTPPVTTASTLLENSNLRAQIEVLQSKVLGLETQLSEAKTENERLGTLLEQKQQTISSMQMMGGLPSLPVLAGRWNLNLEDTDTFIKAQVPASASNRTEALKDTKDALTYAILFCLSRKYCPGDVNRLDVLGSLFDSTATVKPMRTKAATVPASDMNPMKDAIAAAFGWEWSQMDKGTKGEIQAAAKELCLLGCLPSQVRFGYAFCKQKNFTSFRPGALVKWFPEWVKTAAPMTSAEIFRKIGVKQVL